MGAVKYSGTLTDLGGLNWRVDIYDKQAGAGTPETITLAGEGFEINYSGNIRDKANPIITSELKLSLAIVSATDENLLTSLSGSVEGRFTLALYAVAGPVSILQWSGTILADTITIVDEYYPLRAELVASDDIGALSSVPYDNDGTAYPSYSSVTIATHIHQALTKLRHLEDFYSSSDVFLRYANDFYSVDEVGVTDHLNTAKVKYLTFNNPDEEGNNQTLSAYEVLRNICILYNARLMQVRGVFSFFPLGRYFDSQTSLPYSTLLFDGSQGSNGLLNSTNYIFEVGTNKEKLRGFKFEYYQPYKFVERKQIYYGNFAVIGSNIYDLVTAATLSDTDFNYLAGELLKLSGTIQVAYQDAGSPSGANRVGRSLIRLTIKVGSYYLKRPVTYSGTSIIVFWDGSSAEEYTTAVYGASEWTLTPDTFDIISPVFDRQGYYEDPVHGFNIDLEVTLPELPADTFGLDFDGEIYDVSSTGTETLVTDNTEYLQAVITDLRVDYVEDGLVNGDEVTFTATGQASNRDTLTQEAVVLGDVISLNSRGVIQVFDGSGYVVSSGWKSLNTTTAFNINRLGVEEIAALYNVTTKGILGDLYSGLLWPDMLVKDGSDYYLPTSLTRKGQSAETSLEAFRVVRDTTGITSAQGDRSSVVSPVIGFGAKPQTLEPVAPGSTGGVSSVNGVSPDGTGDVTIDAGDIEYTSGTSVSKAILDGETAVTSLESSVIVGSTTTDFVAGTTGVNADKTNGAVSLKIAGAVKGRINASLFTMDVDTDAPQLEATDYTKGLVLRDSTGQRYRITINTSGQLVITAI